MKITNFRNMKTIGKGPLDWEYFADVDVTTGFVLKKITARRVHRTYIGYWHFLDTGEFCPDRDVEGLERAYVAMEKDK